MKTKPLSRGLLFWIATSCFASLALLAITNPLYAQTQNSYEYSPSPCEFKADFPEEPYITKQCAANDPKNCFEKASYTQVYELNATVSVSIVCNPSTEKLYQDYTKEVMDTALKGTSRSHAVKLIDQSFREDDGYKQAGLVGEGTKLPSL